MTERNPRRFVGPRLEGELGIAVGPLLPGQAKPPIEDVGANNHVSAHLKSVDCTAKFDARDASAGLAYVGRAICAVDGTAT